MPRQVVQPLLRLKPGQALFFLVVLNVTDHPQPRLTQPRAVQVQHHDGECHQRVHIRMLIAWPRVKFLARLGIDL